MARTREQFARELAAYARGVFRTALEPKHRIVVQVDERANDNGFLVLVRDRNGPLLLTLLLTLKDVEDALHETRVDEALAALKAAWPTEEIEPAAHPVIGAIARLGRHQPLR